MLFNILTFMTLIREIGRCLLCNSPLTIQHKLQEKMGLCNFFHMKCSSEKCHWMKKVSTSNFVDKTTVASGKVPYDINIRTILTFREIGNGHTAVETFCGLMNMHPPMTYHETIANMHPVYIVSRYRYLD